MKLQTYRGIHVAVKRLLPRAMKQDVEHEGRILSRLCHPYLPYFFGVITLLHCYAVSWPQG